mgnify:CR=1 FL=1
MTLRINENKPRESWNSEMSPIRKQGVPLFSSTILPIKFTPKIFGSCVMYNMIRNSRVTTVIRIAYIFLSKEVSVLYDDRSSTAQAPQCTGENFKPSIFFKRRGATPICWKAQNLFVLKEKSVRVVTCCIDLDI